MSWLSRVLNGSDRMPKVSDPRVWIGYGLLHMGDMMNSLALAQPLLGGAPVNFATVPFGGLHSDAKIRLYDLNGNNTDSLTLNNQRLPDIFINCLNQDLIRNFQPKPDEAPRFDPSKMLTVRMLLPDVPAHMNPASSDVLFYLPHHTDAMAHHTATVYHQLETIPTRVTPEALAVAKNEWRPALQHLSRATKPLHVVVLGERDEATMKADEAVRQDDLQRLTDQLREAYAQTGGSIVLCTSPRTRDAEKTVQQLIQALPKGAVVDSFCYAPGQPNPYLGLLSMADMITVTSDSMSMVSDAIACPVPRCVFVRAPERQDPDIPLGYTQHAIQKGYILDLADVGRGQALPDAMPPINSANEAAEVIREAWRTKQVANAQAMSSGRRGLW